MVSARTRHARRLFAPLPATYDHMGAALSFGQDPRWRRFLVSRIPTDADRVLDVATGTAAVAISLLQASATRRVVGLDQSEPMLVAGVARVRGASVGDRFAPVLAQGERAPFAPGSFDALTFTYLLRYVDDPASTLHGLVDLVRPGGTIASLEFGVPSGLAYPAWWCYTRLAMPLVGLLTSRAWFDVGRFLGPSISRFVAEWPLPAQRRMWRDAGVDDVSVRRMSLGGGVVLWGTRRAAS
jgi:demethylmenaquinone methyltransferase/2-methoxy-6-polyprenyl-1,4-benzoquinol methylase